MRYASYDDDTMKSHTYAIIREGDCLQFFLVIN
jgi:hypothetical protein